MNYRHAFHAGNHADLLKHVVLVWMTVLGYVSQKSTVMLTEAPRSATDLWEDCRRAGVTPPSGFAAVSFQQRQHIADRRLLVTYCSTIRLSGTRAWSPMTQ